MANNIVTTVWKENMLFESDNPSGEILLDNLAMPHSPRIYNDKLYLLESGKGNLIEFDRETKAAKIIFNVAGWGLHLPLPNFA